MLKKHITLKRTGYKSLGAGLLLIMLLGIGSSPQSVSADNCTAITSLPLIISGPGKYCLTADLNVSGNGTAISIQASNVLLDLDGFTISSVDATNGLGIATALNPTSVTVRNGTLKGFGRAIDFYASSVRFATIEALRIQDSIDTGIGVQGTGNVIRNNQIFNTQNPSAAVAINIGIGSGNTVLNNDVVDTIAGGFARGIFISSDRSVVENNRIEHTAAPAAGGIAISTTSFASNVLVVNNRIVRSDFGIFLNNSSGFLRDNIVRGCTTPYSGQFTSGGNNQ